MSVVEREFPFVGTRGAAGFQVQVPASSLSKLSPVNLPLLSLTTLPCFIVVIHPSIYSETTPRYTGPPQHTEELTTTKVLQTEYPSQIVVEIPDRQELEQQTPRKYSHKSHTP